MSNFPAGPRSNAQGESGSRRRRGPAWAWACSWASALLPGSGQILAGDRWLGLALLLAWLTSAGAATWWFLRQGTWDLARIAVQPSKLELIFVILATVAAVHLAIVGHAWWRARPGNGARRSLRAASIAVLAGTLVLVAAPWAIAGEAVLAQRALLLDTFAAAPAPTPPPAPPQPTPRPGETPTPTPAPTPDPWRGQGRLNILLLGSDSGPGYIGARMDTLIVASIDPETGDATMFSLPRNLQHAPFPEGTALAKTFPWGFPDLLNAVYAFGESRPDLVGFTPYPGAEATKAAAEALLGMRIDYFAMVDLLGFVDVVDTLGGVTVETGERIPLTNMAMPGQTLPPAVEVGRQHLDGATALAYVRSRINGTDYDRMDRQRCVLVGLANQTSPVELVMRLPELSGAIRSTMTTDIPLDLLPDLVDLLEKVDMGSVKGVAFTPPEFNPANPDFEAMQATVAAALERPSPADDAANEGTTTAPIDTPENLKASCSTAAAAR